MSASIEDICVYWDRRPCNVRHSQLPVDTGNHFDEVKRRKYFVELFYIPGFADFPCWNGKRVLEIGCGIGTDAVNFARSGADYTGLDLSEVSLELTRTRFQVFGLKSQLIRINAEFLSVAVEPSYFDLVYSFGVIHDRPYPERVIEEIHKVIQPEAQSGFPLARTYTPGPFAGLQGYTFVW